MDDEGLPQRILEEMRANRRKRMEAQPTSPKKRLQQAYTEWLDDWGDGWYLACCLHVPNAMRAAQAGWGCEWLAKHVRSYFNKIDQRVFNDRYAAKRKRVQRFITYEHTPNVGWHAHLLLRTPKHLTQEAYTELLCETWKHKVRAFSDDRFDERLFYCAPIRGRYTGYCLKDAIELGGDYQRPYKGMIDLDNASRGD